MVDRRAVNACPTIALLLVTASDESTAGGWADPPSPVHACAWPLPARQTRPRPQPLAARCS